MVSENPHLSVIVPVYNSEPFLAKSLGALDSFMRGLELHAEIIIVDDGSLDRSRAIADEWAASERPYSTRVIALGGNMGKGAGIARGMLEARGRFRVFLDADLAYEPPQILKILEALEDGCDVAAACRVHPDSRYTISPAFFHYLYTRHLASRVINWFLRRTLIPHCSDSQAGLKGFTAKAADAIFSRQIIRGFPFDIEALYLAQKLGLTIREVPVEYRYFSEPTTVVFMQDGFGMARDIMRIRTNNLLGRYELPRKDGVRRLIVNADDYGMSLPISRGILSSASSGIVRSTSAMANSPDFDASMDEIMSAEAKPDVGFHATLTWGRPLTDPAKIPTLVGRDGKFLSRGRLLINSILGRVSEDEAYIELRAQCERLARRWPVISHLDGHHHIHVFPVIRRAAERVAREFKIRSIRSPREGRWSPWHLALFRRWPVAFMKGSHPAYWRGRGFFSPDNFGGFSLGAGGNLPTRWKNVIKRLPGGTTEIMVHPGYRSSNDDEYNLEREYEMSVLSNKGLIAAIGDAGIELISFKEI